MQDPSALIRTPDLRINRLPLPPNAKIQPGPIPTSACTDGGNQITRMDAVVFMLVESLIEGV